ncbi:MAG: hypothetical protein M3R27_16505 [Bacteroidota bacterium]|nr:hypothetical protein [Bacteroidota bacterium]
MTKNLFLYFSLFLFAFSLSAQVPDTDIWLLDITTSSNGVSLKNPVNVTNRIGYDNQPAFSPDGKCLLYTSMRDGNQSDIFKYELKARKTSQFTNTPLTSEYSPTFMPDGKNISAVMVEADSSQRLWKFPLKGGEPSSLMSWVDSVGYHCWSNADFVYLFLITDPFKLVLADIGKAMLIPVIDSAGRSLHIINGSTGKRIYFAYKGKIWSSSCFNNTDLKAETNIEFETEDFAFIRPDQLIIGNGSKLYIKEKFNTTGTEKWVELIDLSENKIKKISRITVSPDREKLAIVAE